MIMSEPINWCNLKKNIKHIGEVSTSRQDGKPTGAEILTSMNEATGQERDTLEGKLRKMDAQFQDRFATLEPIDWAAGLKVTNPLQVYKYTDSDGVERTYLPDPLQIPFTTGATFSADEAIDLWLVTNLLTINDMEASQEAQRVEILKNALRDDGDLRGWSELPLEEALIAAAQSGVVLIQSGEYRLSKKIVFAEFTRIKFKGASIITFTGSDDYMIDFLKGCELTGDKVTFDADNNDTLACIHVSDVAPVIDMTSCTIKNSTGAALLSQKAAGVGLLNNCTAHNCGRGFHVYGINEDIAATTIMTANNLVTSGSTGHSGNIYWFDACNRVDINGGSFTGHASSSPNCYRCQSVFINGGTYYNINRGPTVGKRTQHFVIQGTRSIDCSYAAIAPDLKDEPLTPDEYPAGYGIVTNNVAVNCGYGCRFAGDDGIISNNYFVGCNTTDGIIRVNSESTTGNPILIQNNYITEAGSLQAIRLGSNTKAILRDNITDSISSVGFGTDADSATSALYSDIRRYSANFDLPTQADKAVIDAGVTDIDLPAKTYGKCKGKEFTLVRGTHAGDISLSLAGGSGTINDGGSYSWPTSHKICTVVCISNGNDYIVSSH